MKVSSTKATAPVFMPVEVRLTLESHQEAEQLFALFNHSGLCGITDLLDHEKIRQAIDLNGTIGSGGTITHSKLCKILK